MRTKAEQLPPLSERDTKQLYRLLKRFKNHQPASNPCEECSPHDTNERREFNVREQLIIGNVETWVGWFADDKGWEL